MSSRAGAVDSYQFFGQIADRSSRLANSSRLARKVRVNGANDDAVVLRLLVAQSDEVSSVERQHGSPLGNREAQHYWYAYCFARAATFLHRHHVMPNKAQLLDDGERKVLVGVKRRHDHSSSLSRIA